MAIVRMIGTVDGVDVIFRPDGSGHWTTSIPDGLSPGYYIIDITAYDEAGNSSYCASKLLTFDPEALIFRIAPLNFSSISVEENYNEAEMPSYAYFRIDPIFDYQDLQQNYYFMEVTKV